MIITNPNFLSTNLASAKVIVFLFTLDPFLKIRNKEVRGCVCWVLGN